MNSNPADSPALLREGDTCWRRARAERGAFLIAGAAYYRTFRRAVLEAEERVFLLAWDLSESIETVRDDAADDGYPHELADFLYAVLEAKPHLEIFILLWDYSMVYIAERDWLPTTRWRRDPHPRLHFELDSAINAGASHHQKVLVVDDAFACCGGLDLSAWRWDTEAHLAADPRRKDPKGKAYQPYQDMQVAVSGAAARALGDLCALRWERATGKRLPRAGEGDLRSLWPSGLEVDFRGRDVGLALTFSEYKTHSATFQIERFHLELIRKARRYLYFENQYLSTHRLVDALCQRLEEKYGPEVVIILTRDAGGMLEEGTLGVLRDRLLQLLHRADRHNRLRVCYPMVTDDSGNESQVYVHSKVIVADDRLVKVGSSNLSNRSMRVDSEVDLILEAPAGSSSIPEARTLLERLLGIHYGVAPEAVRAALERADGSICRAIDRLGGGGVHRLESMPYGLNSKLQNKLADTQLLDPDEPIDPGYWIKKTLDKQKLGDRLRWTRYFKCVLALTVFAIAAVGIGEWWSGLLSREQAVDYLETLRGQPLVWLPLLGCFTLAGLIGLPINLLLVAATVALGPVFAFCCGFVGSLLSAVLAFGLGERFGKPLIRKLSHKDVDALCRRLGDCGIFSVALIRLVPVAPFVVINLVAGFSQLRWQPYLLGSCVGMAPGMLTVVWITHQVRSLVARPNWESGLGTLLAIGLAVGLIVGIKRFLGK